MMKICHSIFIKLNFIVLILILAGSYIGYGHNKEIDSLENLLKYSKGIKRIHLLSELSRRYCEINPKKGIQFGSEAIHLADSLKISSVKSKAFNNLGVNYMLLSQFGEAKNYFLKARQNATAFRDSFELGLALGRMGILSDKQADYDSAIFWMKQEYEIFKNLNQTERIGTSLENLGTVHMNKGELKTALGYMLEAEKCYLKSGSKKTPLLYLKLGRVYAESRDYTNAKLLYDKGIRMSEENGDMIRAGVGLNAVGILFYEQGAYDSALSRYNMALKRIENLNYKQLVLAIYSNIGNAIGNKGMYREAYEVHKKALNLAEELNNPVTIAQEKTGMAIALKNLKDYSGAGKLLEEALQIFRERNSRANIILVYKELIEVNNKLGDFSRSVQYYQEFIPLKDSLDRHERSIALDSLRLLFKTELTTRENEQLAQQTQMQNKTITLQRIIIFASLVGAILLVVIIFLIIRNRAKMKQANAMLTQKNLEISAQSERLVHLNREISELSQFKDSMHSFLVHDLKNLLNGMVHTQYHDNTLAKAETFRHLSKQMLNIISNILDINKYENKAFVLNVTHVPVKSVLQQAFQEVEYLASQKNQTIVFDSPVNFIVKADPDIMKRILINLIINAIKYSPDDSLIRIAASADILNKVRIAVTDKGRGISPDSLPFIFNKFYQANPRESGIMSSSGIGLTFCKMAVESMGGTIGLESGPEEGCKAWFTLPLADVEIVTTIEDQIISSGKTVEIHLSTEEKSQIEPIRAKLLKLKIYAYSDIKETLSQFSGDSEGIRLWKSQILKSVSDLNETKYKELIGTCGEESL